MQLIQDVRSGEHDGDFTGTSYVPVYVMVAVSFSFCFFMEKHGSNSNSYEASLYLSSVTLFYVFILRLKFYSFFRL